MFTQLYELSTLKKFSSMTGYFKIIKCVKPTGAIIVKKQKTFFQNALNVKSFNELERFCSFYKNISKNNNKFDTYLFRNKNYIMYC